MIADVINDLQLVSYRRAGGLAFIGLSRAQDAQGRLIGPDYINKGTGYLRSEISSESYANGYPPSFIPPRTTYVLT